MRKSFFIISAALLFGGASGVSQSPSESFNQFRQQILSDYDSFKSRILEHYADFLNGEWHEFEPLWEEESPYTEPKPKALPKTPVQPEPAPQPAVAKLPTPRFGESSTGGVLAAKPGKEMAQGSITDYDYSSIKINVPGKAGSSSMPSTMAQSPNAAALRMSESAGKSNYERAVLRLPDPGFAFGSCPGQIAAPNPGESGIVNIDMSSRRMRPEDLQRAVEESGYATEETFTIPKNQNNFMFDFYGMEAFIPEIDFKIASAINSPDETGAHWSKMAAQEGGVETARQLFGLAQQLGLNGYLTYRLAESFVNQKFKNSNPAARTSAVHFLLSNMGYDARLLKLNDTFMVMMPFDQKVVYGTMSQTIDGRKYTILYPDGYEAPKAGQSMRLLTCNLPKNALGKTSDLRLTGLSLPMKAKSFNLTNGKLSLTGEVNENIKNLLHHYPQMPTGDFASSWVDSSLRENLVSQLKAQLNGMSNRDAVNSLMSLCHNGFNYSTDQDFHGFEKPYFLEENFIYDKNDCEDRAIFFSYLLWNALGLPCQLVQYPGHESATVALGEDISGYFYNTDGMKYYSSDPTYIGSTVGMVMKAFRDASPTVDKQYK
ncbi:MAG: hypothetical protein K2L22_07545 [Muribaculaceae bacterium]|nr:hypothetical protein [Muribaculaceae bacterium]